MKYLAVLTFILSLNSCLKYSDTTKIPSKSVPIKTNNEKVGIVVDIKNLKKEVSNISVDEVTKDLSRKEKIEFHKSFSDLNEHLNEALRMMDGSDSDFEKRRVRMSYSRAKEVWSYLLKTYRI